MYKLKVRIFLLFQASILMFFATSILAYSASFDCSKGITNTEIAICSDYQLSVDDRIISYLYRKHLNWRKGIEAWWSGNGVEIPIEDIKADQKKWLIESRDLCSGEIDCLKNVLELRIEYFLNLVRLERPRSGSNHKVHFSPQNSMDALRFFSGIFENIQRHSILPKFSNPSNAFHSENLPHASDVTGHDTNELQPITGHIFVENSSERDQLNFGKFIDIDYAGLTECLSSKSLQDVRWEGDWVLLNSVGYTDCVSFHWNDGFVQNTSMYFEEPKELILFPLVQSEYVKKIESDDVLTTFNVCSDTSANRFCQDDLLSGLNALRLRFASEFFEMNTQSISTTLSANNQFVDRVDNCEDKACARELFLESISKLSNLLKYGGNIPPHCRFGSDGTYRCGEAQVCMSGISVFQLTKKSDDKFQLDFWAENWNYDPWNGENIPTQSIEGERYSDGTYPCTRDVYSFDGISMSYGGCTSGDIEPNDTMFWLSCEKGSPFCGAETYSPCVAAK